MPKIYYATGPGVRLAEVIGADGDLRSAELSGNVHLFSLDGKYFYPFSRRPDPDDHDALKGLLEDDNTRPMEYPRGVVERGLGAVEEIEV